MNEITQETLELAALAAGHRVEGVAGPLYGLWLDDRLRPWRPHRDPGDAARLADILGMRVSHPKHAGDGVLVEADGIVPMTVYRSDRIRQYCEAITLCAAQIAKRELHQGCTI